MRAIVVMAVMMLLAGTALAGRCPRDCKKQFGQQLKTCKAECPKRKAGRECRVACVASRKASTKACKAGIDPAPPLCGSTPVVTPTTSTSTVAGSTTPPTTSVPTTTTSSTTTTTCVPTTCESAGAQCGAVDDGCGGVLPCGTCPPHAPVCIEGSCHEACAAMANGTPCDTDASLCTIEQCAGGSCQPQAAVFCPSPKPCFSAVACNPATGTCDSSGYVGDGVQCRSGDLGPADGVCLGDGCAAGKGCAIDGVAYDVGAPNPDAVCQACQPGLSRTAWTPAADGSACPGGLCQAGACSSQVCLIGGVLHAAGTVNPANSCQSCQPDVNRTAWAPVTNGTACAGGVCVNGACDAGSCVVGGAVHADGALNPANSCQKCVVATSRTSWQTLPDFTTCGRGCAFGVCSTLAGGCQISGGACAPNDCATGFCDPQSGECQYVAKNNPGAACSQPSVDGCTATQGTCNAFGVCVRPVLTGNACAPGFRGNPCWSTTAGTCNANGDCVADWLPIETDCRPVGGGNPCELYVCKKDSPTTIACGLLTKVQCLPVPNGCAAGVCNPATGSCDYGPYPSGTLRCQAFGQAETPCCPGQFCAFPPNCGQFCLSDKYCYSPGAVILP